MPYAVSCSKHVRLNSYYMLDQKTDFSENERVAERIIERMNDTQREKDR